MQVVLVKGEDLCAGDSKQKRGMAGDEKLRAGLGHPDKLNQQGELALGRQGCLRLVHEIEAGAFKGQKIGKKAFAMGLLMERFPAITGVIGLL